MKKSLIILCIAVWLVALLCGCTVNADISEYGDTPITILGLTDEEFTVTPVELAQLKCVSRTTSGKSAKAGTISATGPLLDTFLEQYGCKASDFYKIRFLASDGYKVVLKDEYLSDYEIILAVSLGAEPLPEVQRPLKLIIPGADSSKWEHAIVRIEFEREKP